MAWAERQFTATLRCRLPLPSTGLAVPACVLTPPAALPSCPRSCLTWFLEEVKDEVLAHDAFATLLQSCGM